MAGVEGFPPAGDKLLILFSMAGVEGFEPSNGGFKGRCLTTWRHPITSQLDSTLRIPLRGLLRVPSVAPFPKSVQSLRSLDQLWVPRLLKLTREVAGITLTKGLLFGKPFVLSFNYMLLFYFPDTKA
jgi:hypothetical protein